MTDQMKDEIIKEKRLPALQSNLTPSSFDFFDPEQFQAIQRVAKMFANSELVPDMYKITANNPADKAISNCVIAIDISRRIGANILMVMQNLVIIYGKPSWSSKFLIGTVNTCGRYNPLQFKFKDLGELKNYKFKEYESKWENGKKKTTLIDKTLNGTVKNLQCIAYTSEKGSDKILEGPPVTIEIAINEGWYTKSGSKWRTIPKLMLMYRAASWWTNTYAPELSLGMRTEEEQLDIEKVPEVDYELEVDEEIKANANKENIDISTDENTSNEAEKPDEETDKTNEDTSPGLFNEEKKKEENQRKRKF